MRKRNRKKPARQVALRKLRADAAGIDVGATEIYVAVGPERPRPHVGHHVGLVVILFRDGAEAGERCFRVRVDPGLAERLARTSGVDLGVGLVDG